MKMNRITIVGALAVLALIMAPGFVARAATIPSSIPAVVGNIETPDTGVETPEVEAPEVEAPEVEAPEVEAPDIQAPEVQAPDIQAPEVGE